MVITNKSSHIKEVAKVFLSMVTGNKPSLGASRVMGTATAVATGGAYVSTLQKRQYYAIYLVNLETNQIEWVKSATIKKMPLRRQSTTAIPYQKCLILYMLNKEYIE